MNVALPVKTCRVSRALGAGALSLTLSPGFVMARDAFSNSDTLQEVRVQAYGYDRERLYVPVPLAKLPDKILEQTGPLSAVPAFNSLPGVRMEERSPGSFRLSIRGSSMRAPFGVRNVKVYYGGLPFTEPGGTTYLNQLAAAEFLGATLVKGPGGSMYGAGTGGVLLLDPGWEAGNQVSAGYTAGSYGLQAIAADVSMAQQNVRQHAGYQQSYSSGYRRQSASWRRLGKWAGQVQLGGHTRLQAMFLAGDLHYQTPGALTRSEYESDPAAARPASGNFPSASAAGASISQQLVWSGFQLRTQLRPGLSHETGFYAAYTGLRNPAIRNYAATSQFHGGIRTAFVYEPAIGPVALKLTSGAEIQQGISSVTVSENKSGRAGALQSVEDLHTRPWFLFAQATAVFRSWQLAAGLSLNRMRLQYQLQEPSPGATWTRSFPLVPVPRISLAKTLSPGLFIYAGVSGGFSPPAADELLPSGSAFNPGLEAERGTSYEAGLRWQKGRHLFLDANLYYFRLHHTIVARRDSSGGDRYINAGSTRQPGVELSLGGREGRGAAWQFSWQCAYAFQPYSYASFVREQEDFSGKSLPGVARHNVYAEAGISRSDRFHFRVSYNYHDPFPLRDDGLVKSERMHLAVLAAGYKFHYRGYTAGLDGGVDNLLQARYSLGYDINAAGGRYYNAAPPRNYFIRLLLQWR